MPRVFTTEILFRGRAYRCMAAVPDDREAAPIHIRVFDAELSDIIGGNTVELSSSTCHDRPSHPQFSELMKSIGEAVSSYLKV